MSRSPNTARGCVKRVGGIGLKAGAGEVVEPLEVLSCQIGISSRLVFPANPEDASRRFERLIWKWRPPVFSGHRGHQFLKTHEVQYAFQIVGQGDQAPFGADFRQALEQKVVVTQSAFDGAEGVFGQLLP